MLSGTIHGPGGISKFLEDRETGLLEETGRCPEERNQKLQSVSVDIGDVKEVCIMHSALVKGAWKMDEPTCWWRGWDKLPLLASDGHELAAETLGMAGRKESRDETWYGGKTNNVPGSLDIKTALDEAKPKHVAPNWTQPQCTRMANCSPSA